MEMHWVFESSGIPRSALILNEKTDEPRAAKQFADIAFLVEHCESPGVLMRYWKPRSQLLEISRSLARPR